jgi:hypothetical protein
VSRKPVPGDVSIDLKRLTDSQIAQLVEGLGGVSSGHGVYEFYKELKEVVDQYGLVA